MTDATHPAPAAPLVGLTDALQALQRAQQFIRNGRALGFIRMPDADTPDSAHETPGIIDAAIATVRAALASASPPPAPAVVPQEPVATIRAWHTNGDWYAEVLTWDVGVRGLPDGEHKVYIAPPTPREGDPA